MPQPQKPQVVSRIPDDAQRVKILSSVTGREQSPSQRTQAQTWVSWKELGRRLGQPFDFEQIPYSKLRQMRRDPMIRFALHYVKTPLVRAQWRMESEDPQVAAFADAAWRRIHSYYVFQRSLALDFGFSAMVKRFELDFPTATFRDPLSPDTPKPVWGEGNVPAIVWKPFVALPPELADPVWDEATGELAGIKYGGPQEKARASGAGGGGGGDKPDVDIFHTLWGTNEKDSVFGSLFGYPRIAYAYRYWWSYWFRWAMYDRYFERVAVPPLQVWHPDGFFEDPITGERLEMSDVAYEAGNRARANGIITTPSDLADNNSVTGGSAGKRAWEISYLEPSSSSPVDFDKSFNYLDVMKLRSMWVPEQAFIEGEGGTSSRNVAAEMAEIFVQSQANLMSEIDDEINRFILPQLISVNFPDFIGEVKKVTQGFAQEDMELLKQLIQLVGQKDPLLLGVNIPKAMERMGIEVMTPQEQDKQRADLIKAQLAAMPPTATPKPGVAAPMADPGTALGYSYVSHPEVILLSDGDDFIATLPTSSHFADETTRKLALRLRNMYRKDFRERVRDLADQIEEGDLKLVLSESIAPKGQVLLAQDDGLTAKQKAAAAAGVVVGAAAAKKAAKKIVAAWQWPAERLAELAGATANVLTRIFGAAADEVASTNGLDSKVPRDDSQSWAFSRAEDIVQQTDSSLRDELETAVREALLDGNVEPKDLAGELRSRFSDRPASKSGTVAVTETVGAWNTATLMAARANDVKQVQAIDAQKGPTDRQCEDRDGKLFRVRDALKEDAKERHPNCTLEWRILQPQVALSLQFTDEMPPHQMSRYDPDESIVWFSEDSTVQERKRYMKHLVTMLEAKPSDAVAA